MRMIDDDGFSAVMLQRCRSLPAAPPAPLHEIKVYEDDLSRHGRRYDARG